jgi:HK97 gp10 family phage protein
MANVAVVHGLEELKANLRTLSSRVGGEITTRALIAGGKVFQADAKRRAPVLKAPVPARQRGALRAGIVSYPIRWNHVKVRVRSKSYIFMKNDKRAHHAGNPNYWWLVEFGTSKMSARPFMRPAFESQKQAALDAVVGGYKQGVTLAVLGMHKYRMTRTERRVGRLLAV